VTEMVVRIVLDKRVETTHAARYDHLKDNLLKIPGVRSIRVLEYDDGVVEG